MVRGGNEALGAPIALTSAGQMRRRYSGEDMLSPEEATKLAVKHSPVSSPVKGKDFEVQVAGPLQPVGEPPAPQMRPEDDEWFPQYEWLNRRMKKRSTSWERSSSVGSRRSSIGDRLASPYATGGGAGGGGGGSGSDDDDELLFDREQLMIQELTRASSFDALDERASPALRNSVSGSRASSLRGIRNRQTIFEGFEPAAAASSPSPHAASPPPTRARAAAAAAAEAVAAAEAAAPRWATRAPAPPSAAAAAAESAVAVAAARSPAVAESPIGFKPSSPSLSRFRSDCRGGAGAGGPAERRSIEHRRWHGQRHGRRHGRRQRAEAHQQGGGSARGGGGGGARGGGGASSAGGGTAEEEARQAAEELERARRETEMRV